MNARKVILDCDPGIDDALALMLALSLPGLDVIEITVVCGNVPVEKGVKNALKILELMNRTEIPVYAGEAKPLVRPYVDAMDTHARGRSRRIRFSGSGRFPGRSRRSFLFLLMCFYQRNRVLSLRLAR